MDPAEGCHSTDFVDKRVRFISNNHLIATATVREERDEIPHRPTRDKERGLFAHSFRGNFFQAIDGRVLTKNVITAFGACHRLSHLRRGEGYGVATQVN